MKAERAEILEQQATAGVEYAKRRTEELRVAEAAHQIWEREYARAKLAPATSKVLKAFGQFEGRRPEATHTPTAAPMSSPAMRELHIFLPSIIGGRRAHLAAKAREKRKG